MFNLLCAEGGANVGSIVMLVVLVVLLVVYFVFGMRNRKKAQEQAMDMLNKLKTGDKVVTNAGIYGTIVSIKETNMGKVVVLATGEEKKESYITINASVILGIDEKQDLVLDKDGNPIDTETDAEKLKEEVLNTQSTDGAKKTTAKKTSTKKKSAKAE